MTFVENRAEHKLYNLWCDGDTYAGEQLIERHLPIVRRFLANKCSRELEDLLQQVFLRALEIRKQFRGDSSFRTFLLGVARMVLLEHHRRIGRISAREVDYTITSIHALDDSPSELMARSQHASLVCAGLLRLPMASQALLELYYWEDLSLPEIAEVMDIPLGTVKSRVRLARIKLRDVLGALGGAGAAQYADRIGDRPHL